MSDAICAWVMSGYRSSSRARGACQRKFVLYTLARSANNQGWAVGEGLRPLARAVCLSEQQARRHVRILEREGVLTHFEQRDGGSTANVYRVLMPGVDLDATPPKLPAANGHAPPSPREKAEQVIATAALRASVSRDTLTTTTHA
jgi:hypothetical protein